MKQVLVNIEEEIKHLLPVILKKDLQDNERICPTCHGLGVIAVHRVYGIKDDPNPEVKGVHFPYDHQTLTFCPSCYNGVQNLCEFCGKPIQKGYINKCNCEQYKAKELKIKQEKWQETVSKATEVNPNDITNMLYCEEADSYYSDIDDFVDSFDCDTDEIPERLWVTSKQEISIDASNVIESACDDLHEDASDNCDYDSLQKVLNEWCSNQSGTTTYYPSYKEYITVKSEWFE